MTSIPEIAAAAARRPLFLGVDVGGTNTKIGLVDDDGATIAFEKIATHEERGPEDAVQRIAAVCKRLMKEQDVEVGRDVAAVGLGCPGTMDIPRGMVLEPPNLPHWRNFPIRDRLGESLGLPCSWANDANAAAYGEFWIGSGRDHPNLVMLTLGTGVGGGIILHGQSIDGANSFGSECGHVMIDSHEDARVCVWGGGRGQLEAYASAPAVVERTTEALAAGRDTKDGSSTRVDSMGSAATPATTSSPSSLRARIAAGEPLTPLMMFEEAERGDRFSIEMILETAKYLGIGVTSLVHALDPGLVVIGGAMTFGRDETETGRRFLDAVRAEFRRRSFDVVANGTVIDYAKLGGDAGYIGAAGIARAAHHARK